MLFRSPIRNLELGPDIAISTIGDFPEDEAREFFLWAQQRRAAISESMRPGDSSAASTSTMLEVDDQVWARIFAVCGGNAARLALVAETVETPEDLEPGDFSIAFFFGKSVSAVPPASAVRHATSTPANINRST